MSALPVTPPKALTAYRPFWAKRFGPAPFLPMSRQEMEQLGWDSCDIIIVTGDAYVDHPSFGMAVIGRTLEAQGWLMVKHGEKQRGPRAPLLRIAFCALTAL